MPGYFYDTDARAVEFAGSTYLNKRWDACREKPQRDTLLALGGEELSNAVVNFREQRGPIVELGCKIGSNANLMGEVPYYGVEQSRELCNEANRRFEGVRSVSIINESPTECRTVRDDEAEFLFSVFSVHDYSREDVNRIARECRRILRRGNYGYFFIVNPEVYYEWKGDESLGFFRQISDVPNRDEVDNLMTGTRRDSKWGSVDAQFYFHSEDTILTSLDAEGLEITDKIDYYYKEAGVPGKRKLIKFRKP